MSKNIKRSIPKPLIIVALLLFVLTAGLFYKLVQRPNYTAKDLAWSGETPDAPMSITAEQTKEDINLLLYALDHAYVGKDFIQASILAKVKRQLNNIPNNEPISTDAFWKKVHEALTQIPDNHLAVLPPDNLIESIFNGLYKFGTSENLSLAKLINNLPDHLKSKFKLTWKSWFKKRGVGSNKNISHHPWFIKRVSSWKEFFSKLFSWFTEEELAEKNIILIAITHFLDPKSDKWEGFLSQVENELLQADAIILDLRDAKGSNDAMAYRLAKLLYGSDSIPDPVDCIYFKNTPGTYTIHANYIKQNLQETLSQGDNIEDLQTYYDDLLKKAEEAKEKNSPKYYSTKMSFAYEPAMIIEKPIIILTNKNCTASGEIMVDLLEAHPHATRVGEKTAGCIHFSIPGFFLLPHSKLRINMPCQYRAYRDKRFIERIGIAPHIYAPAGKDAFDIALTLLKQKLRTFK